MDLKALLEKIDQFAGQAVGQKPGDQWRGSDKAPPGKKLVGDSILKDLSKGKSPKSKEQELAEEFQAFLEAEFKDTVDKRPARKNARPSRGHEPQPRYTTIKTENWPKEVEFTPDLIKALTAKGYKGPYKLSALKNLNRQLNGVEGISGDDNIMIKGSHWVISAGSEFLVGAERQMAPATTNQLLKHLDESSMSEKDIELQDYRSMSHKEFQTAYGMTKTEWINQNKALIIQNPDIKRALGLEEGWESGPEEYKEPYDDADDAYDRMRQDKIDTEAEKEWAKLPKVTTYKLYGRGPNMEPNYAFGDELDSMEKAIEYRKQLIADPKTPHPEHIGIHTITRVKDQTNEAIDSDMVQAMGQDAFNRAGYNPIRNERDYLDTLSKLRNLALQPGLDQSMKDHITQRVRDLNAEALKKGYIKAESRGHKIVSNKLKDIERAKKFASGELKIPTPQERQAQLKQLEKEPKQVKEYGANNPPQNANPAQAQQIAANLNIQKTALNQLKQINPEIDPQKAATAMTKDTATMSPQEKDELAQVAKTVGPALGTPAFGSIKTAIQKSQLQAKK